LKRFTPRNQIGTRNTNKNFPKSWALRYPKYTNGTGRGKRSRREIQNE
jgi:hypothetical protein